MKTCKSVPTLDLLRVHDKVHARSRVAIRFPLKRRTAAPESALLRGPRHAREGICPARA
jgi:hypothetical protein